jgi:hypothetical protein
MVYEIVRHDPAAARKRLESQRRLLPQVGSFPMSRERKTREIGKYGAHGPALSAGPLPDGLQNVVRYFERGAHNSDANTSNIRCIPDDFFDELRRKVPVGKQRSGIGRRTASAWRW